MKHIWLAVTPDKYELPIAHARTAGELANIMGVKESTVLSMESRYRNGITHGGRKYKARKNKFGQYRIIKVNDTEEGADERA